VSEIEKRPTRSTRSVAGCTFRSHVKDILISAGVVTTGIAGALDVPLKLPPLASVTKANFDRIEKGEFNS